MTTLHLKKSISRSPSRFGFFLPALAVACFALLPSTGTAECDTKQVNGAPNFRLIRFSNLTFESPGQCTPEKVRLSGVLHVTFDENEKGRVRPVSTHLEDFSCKGLNTPQRTYVATDNDVRMSKPDLSGNVFPSGAGNATFNIIIRVKGNPNPALGANEFNLKWHVLYVWSANKKVTDFLLLDDSGRHLQHLQCKPEAQCPQSNNP
jgi:hypothetical protein